ncbi:ribosomal-processing cysteine protease Prp [Paenibacillus yanchengensis]|uniref:Ribosomal processing cysteine protease Prp n=1 Tax=Paenibacillus yanchengensis TaxID=2035833 RepID=A0ABW4YLA9_9BACL
MIRVIVERNRDSHRVENFTIKGHAFHGDPGEDIVCAAVSAVSIGIVNSIQKLVGVQLPATMDSGWLSSYIPAQADCRAEEKVQLLLEAMLTTLSSIAHTYSKHVSIKEKFR